MYYVIRGSAVVIMDGREVPASAGELSSFPREFGIESTTRAMKPSKSSGSSRRDGATSRRFTKNSLVGRGCRLPRVGTSVSASSNNPRLLDAFSPQPLDGAEARDRAALRPARFPWSDWRSQIRPTEGAGTRPPRARPRRQTLLVPCLGRLERGECCESGHLARLWLGAGCPPATGSSAPRTFWRTVTTPLRGTSSRPTSSPVFKRWRQEVGCA